MVQCTARSIPFTVSNLNNSCYCRYCHAPAAEEPLLGMNAPAANGEVSGEEEGEGDETEPLPGDEHYPLLERKMQMAYERLVSCLSPTFAVNVFAGKLPSRTQHSCCLCSTFIPLKGLHTASQCQSSAVFCILFQGSSSFRFHMAALPTVLTGILTHTRVFCHWAVLLLWVFVSFDNGVCCVPPSLGLLHVTIAVVVTT